MSGRQEKVLVQNGTAAVVGAKGLQGSLRVFFLVKSFKQGSNYFTIEGYFPRGASVPFTTRVSGKTKQLYYFKYFSCKADFVSMKLTRG